jgi:hypothetical protein
MFGDLIGIGCGFWIADGCRFTRWQIGGGQSRIFTMDDIGPTKLMRLTDCIFSSNFGNQSIFSWAAYSAYTVGSGINYASKTFTVPSAGSIWDRLAEIVGDQHLAGRVAYNQSGTWRWGTTTAVYSDGTVAGPLHIDVQWDTGAGGGITNGTVIRFYKMTECDWTSVAFDGWTSVPGAPSVANYDRYVLAGQQIPADIWDVSTP